MLKYFHTFQTSHPSGIPHCYGLLCIGKRSAEAIPYAWVDTITTEGEVHYDLINHASSINFAQVKDTIWAMTETTPPTLDDYDLNIRNHDVVIANQTLMEHMVERANQKLVTRAKWYMNQGRLYCKSHFAALDAAFAQHPRFNHVALEKQLYAEREGVPYTRVAHLSVNEGLGLQTTGRTKKWTWAEYDEPKEVIKGLLKGTSCHQSLIAYNKVSKMRKANDAFIAQFVKKTQTRTPKGRLKLLIELVEELPHTFFRDTTMSKLIDWKERNPAPLQGADPEVLAQLPKEELMELLAAQWTWMDQWYIIWSKVRNTLTYEQQDYVRIYEYDEETGDIHQRSWDEDVLEWANQQWENNDE